MPFSLLLDIIKVHELDSFNSNEKGRIPINIRNLQMLLDIQSLQSMGQRQNFGITSPTTFPFQKILDDMMSSSLSTTNPTLPSPLSDLNNLEYNGANQVFKPQALTSMIQSKDHLQLSKISSKNTSGNYNEIIKNAAEKYNVPSQLISSVIKHESNFNKDAVSHAGAQGLMQLMPGTARFLGIQDSFNPTQNIQGGTRYLRQMLDQFDNNIEHALAAYNAGPGNVRKYNGIPPFKETQAYVKKVLNTFYS